jgi:NADPH:quinone reductase-like Zn-dependent oxidoreductase
MKPLRYNNGFDRRAQLIGKALGGPPLTPAWQRDWRLSMSHQQVVFITGASSGGGHSTARWLAQKGYKVFGTSRTPASAEALPTVGMVALVKHHDGAM